MRWTAVLVAAASMAMGQPWSTDLAFGGSELWRSRVAVQVGNQGAEAVAGAPVEVPIGATGLPLAGARAQDIRATDDAGTELLFDLRGPNGRLTEGAIPDGARLVLPVAAPAGGSQRLWVYWNHPDAYPVPDYLKGSAALANASFEAGGTTVDAWDLSGADAQHRITWSKESPRTGERCVKVEVDAGAESTWIAARQAGIGLQGGRRYRVSGWAKGRDVVGRAGWFIHVATGANAMAINRVEGESKGTFDWQQTVIEFTAPDGAQSLTVGTVLFGTGTAWFDDVKVEALDAAKPAVTATVGAVEQLKLAEIGPGEWPTTGPLAKAWCRGTAIVYNTGDAAASALVAVPAKALTVRVPKGEPLAVWDPRTSRPIPHLISGDSILMLIDVPARCRLALPVYVGVELPGRAMTMADLVDAPGNLAPNPGFEDGTGDKPASWSGGTEGVQAEGVSVTRVKGGARGEWCGRSVVPAAAPARWVGWRKAVPCDPNTDYFFSARVKTEGLTGPAPLYVHFLDDKGEWAGQRGGSTGTGPSGTTDWTTIGSIMHSGPDTKSFEMHLTMNNNGTVWHDDVVLRRAVAGRMGGMENRARPGGGLTVWALDPIVKPMRDAVPPQAAGPSPVPLAATRGERETLQLCLRTNTDMAGVKLSATCAGLPLKIERVGYVPVLQPGGYFNEKAQAWERLKPHGQSRTDGWQGWWPDYLLPLDKPLDLRANQTQAVWVTMTVPRDAQPGVHRGQVVIAPATGAARTVDFTLTVWPFTQPERASLQVIYDLRSGGDHDAWLKFMAEHRVCPDSLPSPKFELRDGKVSMDATLFDKEATRRFDELKMSAAYLPEVFYACGWAYPPRDFLGCRYPSPEYKSAYQQALKLLWDHCHQRGWSRYLTLYVSDEPHFDRPEVTKWLGEVIGYAREVAPDITVYSSTWRHNKAWDGILNHWGVGQYGCFPTDEIAARRRAGDKIWFTTDGQMEIDTPYAACERMLPWYCFAHDVSGYEFWGLSWYTYDPYRYGWHSFIQQADEPGEGKSYNIRYPNGDGYLAYPGEPLGRTEPVASIRLEQARDGIEDYEVFAALAKLAADKPALAPRIELLLKKVRDLMVIPNAGGYRTSDWLPDPLLPARLRLEAGDLLTRLGSAR